MKNTLGTIIAPITFILGENEIGLLFNHKQFVKVLPAGKHKFNRWGTDYALQTIKLNKHNKLETDANTLMLIKKYPEAFADVVTTLATQQNEIIFATHNGKIFDVVTPASEAFIWNDGNEYSFESVMIEDAQAIDKSMLKRLRHNKNILVSLATKGLLQTATVANHHKGLLHIDDQFSCSMPSGEYAWWTLGSAMNMLSVDMRLQNMEVSGQEILTQDRVSIRLNLLSTWQVEDAEKLVLNVKNYSDFIYREMQLALRTVVATKTLDELLADKNLLNSEVKAIVEPIAEAQGISVQSVGVKDVILPGEMKDILSKVVEAQKTAEANIIKRREETQATRSLHNTAKVMENNPVLLRLKELESLEKITSQISELNVYGGMDGLMNGLIDLRREKT